MNEQEKLIKQINKDYKLARPLVIFNMVVAYAVMLGIASFMGYVIYQTIQGS